MAMLCFVTQVLQDLPLSSSTAYRRVFHEKGSTSDVQYPEHFSLKFYFKIQQDFLIF
jgi:hypothetical protein